MPSRGNANAVRMKCACAILAGGQLAGCASTGIPRSEPVASQPLAGTVLIAPTGVPPWEDVAPALKPNFALTGDQALSQVLQTTESIDDRVMTSLGFSLAAGLPTHSTSFNSTTTSGGTSPGTVSTETTTRAPGTAPTFADLSAAGVSLPGGTPFTGTLGLDPILRYKAAYALYQSVQLLNQYTDNATNRTCYVPYVVQLKLTVVNYRPRLPYSVNSHIGFFYNGKTPTPLSLARGKAERDRIAAGGKAETTTAERGPTPVPSAELAADCQLPDLVPAVIPLLVTDDVQVAVKSRAAEAASQIAGALSGLIGGVGIGANAKYAKTSLTAIANHDLTSTLTIGRESENTLLAVITPNNQASNDPALVSQSYDVAVLVLIPRYYFGGVRDISSTVIGLSTFTQYRDAKTGAVLPQRSPEFLAAQAGDLIESYLTPPGRKVWNRLSDAAKAREAERLMGPVVGAQEAAFFDVVGCADAAEIAKSQTVLCPGGASLFSSSKKSLWTVASTLASDNVVKAAVFQAQLPAPITVPSQQVLLTDDGNHQVQAVLGQVSARAVTKLAAVLRVTPYDKAAGKAAPAPVSIPAQALSLDTAAHTLTLSFPSLKKLGIDCLSPVADAAAPAVRPKKPAKEAKGAAGRAGAPPAAASPDPSTCPTRSAGEGAGSNERPNGIQLSLIGCDPTRQLCPALTETAFTVEDWRLRRGRLSELRSRLGMSDVVEQADVDTRTAAATKALAAATSAVDAEEQAEIALSQARANDAGRESIAPLEQALSQIKALAVASSITAEQAVEDARLTASATDRAIIGVSLTSSGESTTPAKFTMSDAGDVINIVPGGTGALTIAVNGFKAPSTGIAVITSGAGLVSVVGISSGNVAFDDKHGFVLRKNDVYTFNFTGLQANGVVTVKLQALNGDKNADDPLSHSFRAQAALQQAAK
jgi:hypothetical protein